MNKIRVAKYTIGQVVRHRVYPFRGVVFDIDPLFNNTEEWYQSIPAEVRPHKDQPGEPVRHPQVAEVFERDEAGGYHPRNTMLN